MTQPSKPTLSRFKTLLYQTAIASTAAFVMIGLYSGKQDDNFYLADINASGATPHSEQRQTVDQERGQGAPSDQENPPTPRAEDRNALYEVAGKRFILSYEVESSLRTLESRLGIPFDGALAVCARESDCQPRRVNPSSGACGLFQFMTNRTETLYEVMHKYGAEQGYPEAEQLVERYVRRRDSQGRPHFGYRPVNEQARQEALELCLNPTFNAVMWGAYKAPLVERYNEWLGDRTMTAGEFTAMNNLGLRGLQAFSRQVWKDSATGRDTLAVDFFKANRRLFGGDISANRTLIRHTNGNYKTLREAYADMFRFGGGQKIQIVPPDEQSTEQAASYHSAPAAP